MDIITNHTADVIQLEGNAGYRDKTDFPYTDVNGQPFDDSEFAYSGQQNYSFPAGRRHQLPVQPGAARRRGERQEPGLAQRSDCSTTTAATAASTARTRCTATSSGSTTCGPSAKRSSTGWSTSTATGSSEFGIDGFRIDTTKHVNMEFWQKSGRRSSPPPTTPGIDRLLHLRRGVRPAVRPQFKSEFSTTGKLPATIDFASRSRPATSPARAAPPTACATCSPRTTTTPTPTATPTPADVPGQPRHGPHRLLPQRVDQVGRERRRAARPLATRPRADVLRPRPAGDLLRRRAGVHRRRRRQGRPRGHVRQHRGVVQRR